MKQCNECLESKELEEFSPHKECKLGVNSKCKSCKTKIYYNKVEPKIIFKDNTKKCSHCSIFKPFSSYTKNKNKKGGIEDKCKDCIKLYKQKNKDKIKQYNKKYNYSDKGIKNKELYYTKNKKQLLKNSRERHNRLKGTKEYRESNNRYIYEREKKDPIFKISNRIRTLIRISIKKKGKNKKLKSEDILGCSISFFKEYIENQFESWMNWDNYGKYNGEYDYGWDLDHVVPMNIAITEQDLYSLNYWTNFQPLCSRVNRYDKKHIF